MSKHRPYSFVRLAGIAVGAASLSIAFLGNAAAAPSHPAPNTVLGHHATINTYRDWDKSSSIAAFGCPDTTTYGQTITVPAGKSSLRRFNFYMQNFVGSRGSMVIRGEVYAWNGSMATGPDLWESAPMTIAYADDSFHKVAFHTGGVSVTPGAQYILFASISKDFGECSGDNYLLDWGATSDSAYADGTFAFLNDSGDPSQWTTVPWVTFGLDLAFKAVIL